jgi:hypothetical protein
MGGDMKFLMGLLMFTLISCSSTEMHNHDGDNAHSEVMSHKHVHGKDCGHKRVVHNGHSDYIHDGEYHRAHEDHVDFHGATNKGRELSSTSHEHKHKNHAHMHGDKCGHKKVKHDDHWDYLHDGHYHHKSKEHGVVTK